MPNYKTCITCNLLCLWRGYDIQQSCHTSFGIERRRRCIACWKCLAGLIVGTSWVRFRHTYNHDAALLKTSDGDWVEVCCLYLLVMKRCFWHSRLTQEFVGIFFDVVLNAGNASPVLRVEVLKEVYCSGRKIVVVKTHWLCNDLFSGRKYRNR